MTITGFALFLGLPGVPYVAVLSPLAEASLALWLLAFGVNEAKWGARASVADCGLVS